MAPSIEDKFILHWLDASRAQRIVWLLEVLGLNYEVKVYFRNPKTLRAPPTLKEIHPVGKLPLLQIIPADGGKSRTLAESGYICQFISQEYDFKGVLKPKTEDEQFLLDYYLHYAEGTIQWLNVGLLVNSEASRQAPWGGKTIAGIVASQINQKFYLPEMLINFDFLEKQLQDNGTGYFVGDKLSAADILFSFPVYENILNNPDVKKFSSKVDVNKRWPHLVKWGKEVIASDKDYIRSNELMEKKIVQEKANKL